jgi:hypothetical protein
MGLRPAVRPDWFIRSGRSLPRLLGEVEAGRFLLSGQVRANDFVDREKQNQRAGDGDAPGHGEARDVLAPMWSKFLAIPYCLFTNEVSKTDHKLFPAEGLY